MKTTLLTVLSLFVLMAAPRAQFIGQWYGSASPNYQSGCGVITPPWIYAHGSDHLGGNIIIRGISREHWYVGCPVKPHTFLMTIALGWNQANYILPADITGYADTILLCEWDAIGAGIQDGNNPEYFHIFQLPTDPSFIGEDFFAQWGMMFIDPVVNQWRIMTSRGLRIVIQE